MRSTLKVTLNSEVAGIVKPTLGYPSYYLSCFHNHKEKGFVVPREGLLVKARSDNHDVVMFIPQGDITFVRHQELGYLPEYHVKSGILLVHTKRVDEWRQWIKDKEKDLQ